VKRVPREDGRRATDDGRARAVARLPAEIPNAALARRLARAPDTQTDEAPITAPGMTGAEQWHERGMAHHRAGRFARAVEAFAKAYELNPVSTFLYDQADALERLGRDEEAAAMYERYLAAGPLTADIPKVRSRIRKLRGETIPEGADADAPDITAKGAAGARQWFDRGQSAFQAGRYAHAADCFRHAYGLLAKPAFLFDEGSALEKGRHPAAAANAFEHYLIADPAADDAGDVIAKIKRLRGQAPANDPDGLLDPEDDAAAAPAVTATGNTGASDWYARAAVAYRLGDYQRAYDGFVAAYDLKPYSAFVYNQAACLDQLGNVQAAVQAYERYLALEPRARDAARIRERIRRLRDGSGQLRQP
jgi:tetratricopeptide (TPR) repeat protein